MEYMKFSAKTVDAAVNQAMADLHAAADELEYEVLEKGSTGLFGIGSKPAVIQARKKFTLEGAAEDFLGKIFQYMKMDVAMDIVFNEEEKALEIDLKGDNMGILIGKRGQTLDALQYLTSLVINKYTEEYIRVKLDIENYRERRKETLETLARNIAYKVRRTKRPVSLEPMNPYERRIIHSTLQNDKYVVTRSEGDEPFRHVVISLKKERRDYDNHSYGSRGSNYHRNYNRGGYNRNGYNRDYGGHDSGHRYQKDGYYDSYRNSESDSEDTQDSHEE